MTVKHLKKRKRIGCIQNTHQHVFLCVKHEIVEEKKERINNNSCEFTQWDDDDDMNEEEKESESVEVEKRKNKKGHKTNQIE